MISSNSKELTSFSLAQECDYIYSGVFEQEQLKNLGIDNFRVFKQLQSQYLVVKNRKINFYKNINIFSSLDFVEELFYLIKEKGYIADFNLYTHQSDRSVDSKLFNKRPHNLNKWYSTNVNHRHDNLINIPIGIANNHPKNLRIQDIQNTNIVNANLKNKLLYVNFQANTNKKHRQGLYDYFRQFDWAEVDEPNITHSEYAYKIKSIPFNLAPWGNGFDTHRFWETVYLHSIPITKKQYTYDNYNSFPYLQVDDYSQIDKLFLINKLNEINKIKYDYKELNPNYWIQNNKEAKNMVNTEENVQRYYFIYFLEKKHNFILKFKSKLKIIKYYLNKII